MKMASSNKVSESDHHRRKSNMEEYEEIAAKLRVEDESDEDKPVPIPKKVVLLKRRKHRVDLDSKLRKSVDFSKHTSKSKSGYYCNDCHCVAKGSKNFLYHINGKKHQRNLGMSKKIDGSSLVALDQIKKTEEMKKCDLDKHSQELNEELIRQYHRCHICKSTYGRVSQKEKCLMKHGFIQCYKCLELVEAIGTDAGLSEHFKERRHGQDGTSLTSCPFCSELFTYSSLKYHIDNYHLNRTRFVVEKRNIKPKVSSTITITPKSILNLSLTPKKHGKIVHFNSNVKMVLADPERAERLSKAKLKALRQGRSATIHGLNDEK